MKNTITVDQEIFAIFDHSVLGNLLAGNFRYNLHYGREYYVICFLSVGCWTSLVQNSIISVRTHHRSDFRSVEQNLKCLQGPETSSAEII